MRAGGAVVSGRAGTPTDARWCASMAAHSAATTHTVHARQTRARQAARRVQGDDAGGWCMGSWCMDLRAPTCQGAAEAQDLHRTVDLEPDRAQSLEAARHDDARRDQHAPADSAPKRAGHQGAGEAGQRPGGGGASCHGLAQAGYGGRRRHRCKCAATESVALTSQSP